MKHASHPEITARLKQAHGHIGSILTMFAEGRSCVDLAQQLQSVESLIHTVKRTLIQDHMEHCIADARGFARIILRIRHNHNGEITGGKRFSFGF